MEQENTIQQTLQDFLNRLTAVRENGRVNGWIYENIRLLQEWIVLVKTYLKQVGLAKAAEEFESKSESEYDYEKYSAVAEGFLRGLIDKMTRDSLIAPRQLPKEPVREERKSTKTSGKRVFIVHGREEGVKYQVARFLEKSGLEAVILHEKPSQSKAIIEKLEKYSDVAYTVVLLTPDDIGKLAAERTKPQSRARQNVVFELGFFMGKLGRDRVCVLYEDGVELPSDFKGVVYIPLDRAGAWKMSLAKELKAIGLEVNFDEAI